MALRPLIGGSITRKEDGSIAFGLAIDDRIPPSALASLFQMISACVAVPPSGRTHRNSGCRRGWRPTRIEVVADQIVVSSDVSVRGRVNPTVPKEGESRRPSSEPLEVPPDGSISGKSSR